MDQAIAVFPWVLAAVLFAWLLWRAHVLHLTTARIEAALGITTKPTGAVVSTVIAAVHDAVTQVPAAIAAAVSPAPITTPAAGIRGTPAVLAAAQVATPLPTIVPTDVVAGSSLTQHEISSGVFDSAGPATSGAPAPAAAPSRAATPGWWSKADADALGITVDQASQAAFIYCEGISHPKADLTLTKAWAYYKSLGTGDANTGSWVPGEPAKG